eukprot:6048591-Amphidinium_carterae.1
MWVGGEVVLSVNSLCSSKSQQPGSVANHIRALVESLAPDGCKACVLVARLPAGGCRTDTKFQT